MTENNRSGVWSYFDKVDRVNKEAECRLCHNVYKYKGTSHNLKLHLKHKHNDIFLRMPDSELPETRKRANGTEVWSYFEPIDTEKKLASCNACRKSISYKTTTANLKTHLRLVHKEQHAEMMGEDECEEVYLEDEQQATVTIPGTNISIPLTALTGNQMISIPGSNIIQGGISIPTSQAISIPTSQAISIPCSVSAEKPKDKPQGSPTQQGGGVAVRGGVGSMGMVPVQVPVSVANGHTVYQTVHLPVHAPQHLQIIPQLQQVYRDNVCLWDMSSELYRIKEMKHEAWGLLTRTLRKLDPDANLCTTKKKVENLRAVYFRELKKVRQSQLNATDEGDVFVPNLWYFKLISFLDRQDWGPCRTTDPLQECDVKRTPVTSEPLQSAECDTVKRPPESDEESMESATELEILDPENPKRKWLTRDTLSARKIKRKDQSYTAQTFVEPLHFTEPKQAEDTKGKKTNSFAVYVGEQLEQITTLQRHVAEKLISEVLFLAKTNHLNYDSKIETSKMHGSRCQTPEYNILSSLRKVEVEPDSESSEEKTRTRTLLKELLSEGKQK